MQLFSNDWNLRRYSAGQGAYDTEHPAGHWERLRSLNEAQRYGVLGELIRRVGKSAGKRKFGFGHRPKLLDLACGEGLLGDSISSDWHYHGVDISAISLRRIKRKGERIQGDLNDSNFLDGLVDRYRGFFDAVVISEAYYYIEHRMTLLERLRLLLKAGGEFIVSMHVSDVTLPLWHELNACFWAVFSCRVSSRDCGFDFAFPCSESRLEISLLAVDGEGRSAERRLFNGSAINLKEHRNRLVETKTRLERTRAGPRIEMLKHKPLFSIVCPLFNSNPRHLTELIESIQRQVYDHWELIMVDDGSSEDHWIEMRRVLECYSVNFARDEQKGISAATNHACRMSSGDYLVFVDHDDMPTDDALLRLAFSLDDPAGADALYSNEATIGEDGGVIFNDYKQEWHLVSFLSHMYTGHLCCIRREFFLSIGALRSEFDGAQDFDLMLRASRSNGVIRHVDRTLYLWRAAEGSSALEMTAKSEAIERARLCIEDYFLAESLDVRVLHARQCATYHWIPRHQDGKDIVMLWERDVEAETTGRHSYLQVGRDEIGARAWKSEGFYQRIDGSIVSCWRSRRSSGMSNERFEYWSDLIHHCALEDGEILFSRELLLDYLEDHQTYSNRDFMSWARRRRLNETYVPAELLGEAIGQGLQQLSCAQP